MKAAVCHSFNKPLVIEEVSLANPGPGEVLVDIKACAICHSDIFYAEGAWGGNLPAVYGHEAAGVVRATGTGVERVSPGDHVVVTLIRSCGHCHYCSRDVPVMCEETAHESPITGANGESYWQAMSTGAFAEQVVVHESQMVRIAKDIAFEPASLLACGVLTGFGAVVNTAKLQAGQSAVVIGLGGVGLNCVQGAAIAGADPLITLDVADDKLKASKAFGATHAINARSHDARTMVMDLTGGRGADYVFVSTGAVQAFDSAPQFIKRCGTVVAVGMPPDGVFSKYEPATIAALNQRIVGSKMGDAHIMTDIPKLVDYYLAGKLKLDELITGRYRLEQINEAIAEVNAGGALRNVIVFD